MFTLVLLGSMILIVIMMVDKRFASQFCCPSWLGIAMVSLALTTVVEWLFNFSFVVANLPILFLAISLTIVLFCFFNYKNLGIIAVTIGGILNLLVTTVNDGRMPIDLRAYKIGNFTVDLNAEQVFMTEKTRLIFLGDWLYFPYAGSIFSPGDVLICLGLLILAVQYQKFRYKQTRF